MFACLPHPNWMNVSILFTVVRSFIRVQVDLIKIYRDHGNTRSAIDSDIMIDRLLHCTFFVRVFVSHAVLSKWKSTVVSLLTAEIALLLVTGTLLKARQGCKRRSKRIDSMHAESTQIHHARSTFFKLCSRSLLLLLPLVDIRVYRWESRWVRQRALPQQLWGSFSHRLAQ